MHDVKSAVFDALQGVRDLLLDVGVLIERTDLETLPEAVPEMDLALRDAWYGADMCRRLCLLFRVPQIKAYDPAALLRRHSGQERIQLPVTESVAPCLGDPDQVLECFRLFRDAVTLGSQGSLRTEIVTEGDAPRVLLTLEGGGRLPEALLLGQVYRFDLDGFAGRWISATDGGHIALAESAAILYLRGDRSPTGSVEGLDGPLASLTRLTRRLMSWRGATGHYEPGLVSAAEMQRLYAATVATGMELIGETVDELGIRKPFPS